MTPVLPVRQDLWPWAALAVSAAMLAAAHAFQRFGGLDPCILCLRQREVYWAALTVAAAGLALGRLRPAWFVRLVGWPVVNLLLAALFAVGAGVAVYHAGAEWKWWPGPAACSAGAGGALDMASVAAMLGGAAKPVVRCDEAAWVFAGLSMAGWNALVSLALAVVSLVVARRGAPAR